MHHQLGEPTNMIKKHVKKTEVFECRLKTLEFCCQRVTKTEGKGKKCCEYSRTDHFDAQHKIHKFFCACFLLSFAFFCLAITRSPSSCPSDVKPQFQHR